MKKFKKNKDLIKHWLNNIDKQDKLTYEEKLANYILRLNNIKLDKPDLKKVLQNLHNFQS